MSAIPESNFRLYFAKSMFSVLIIASTSYSSLINWTFNYEDKIDFEQVYFDIKTLGVRKTPEKQVQTLSFEE